MPTVLRIGAFRLFFYSADGGEPAHIHVQRDRNVTKYWLDPVRLADPGRYAAADLNTIARIVHDHEEQQLDAWDDYFNG